LIFEAARSFLAMLSSSDEIVRDCYAGFADVKSHLNETKSTFTPSASSNMNVVYHFQEIYGNLQSLFFYFV
jgi:hypothetical protein